MNRQRKIVEIPHRNAIFRVPEDRAVFIEDDGRYYELRSKVVIRDDMMFELMKDVTTDLRFYDPNLVKIYDGTPVIITHESHHVEGYGTLFSIITPGCRTWATESSLEFID